ncbi:MAG TPA: response regulator, partial [Verrucomicrobiaceae bacterium]
MSQLAPPPPEPAALPPVRPEAAVAILLVDDDPRNLTALESILEPSGHCLTKVQSAEDALLALMRQDYAAIVMDVEMPGISGIDLARMI